MMMRDVSIFFSPTKGSASSALLPLHLNGYGFKIKREGKIKYTCTCRKFCTMFSLSFFVSCSMSNWFVVFFSWDAIFSVVGWFQRERV